MTSSSHALQGITCKFKKGREGNEKTCCRIVSSSVAFSWHSRFCPESAGRNMGKGFLHYRWQGATATNVSCGYPAWGHALDLFSGWLLHVCGECHEPPSE